MFLGEYAHTLDTKGRLTVPVKFREALASGAVVTRGYDKNLHLYTREAFEALTQQLRALIRYRNTTRARPVFHLIA